MPVSASDPVAAGAGAAFLNRIASAVMLRMRVLRLGEALLMVGFPVAAALFGMETLDRESIGAVCAIAVALGAVSISVYAANTWAGWTNDFHDPKFAAGNGKRNELQRVELIGISILTLAVGCAAWAILLEASPWPVLGLWFLWLLYSHPKGLKHMPFGGTLAHLVGGIWLFFVPYSFFRQPDGRGLILSIIMVFAFVAGHLNHEILDHETDARSGIRTTAVRFGPHFAHALGVLFMAIAYGAALRGLFLGWLSLGEALPFIVVAPLHLGLAVQSGRGGPNRSDAAFFRRAYRLLFGGAVFAALVVHGASLI